MNNFNFTGCSDSEPFIFYEGCNRQKNEMRRLIDYKIPFTTDPEDFCDVFDGALLFHIFK